MKIDKNSNVYIIVYIIVLVVVVGTALAFTSMSLKDKQQQNIAADKMKQILASVHIVASDNDVKAEFSRTITEQFVVNSAGKRTEGNAFDIDVAKQVKLPADQRLLPVFVANTPADGIKYILPAYGAGLWGPIWGYIALNTDGSTVYGAFFSHQGETPGLGAEIAKPDFSNRFIGKNLFVDGHFLPIEVVKKGLKPKGNADYVDGISGGTITSKGVGAMLDNCLSPYESFLKTIKDE